MPIIPAPLQLTPADGAAGAKAWPEHRAAPARHGRLWEREGLTFFRAATVDWR